MDKIKSRTFWIVTFMTVASTYMGDKNTWDPSGVALVWGTLLAAWIGGKGWAAFVEKRF